MSSRRDKEVLPAGGGDESLEPIVFIGDPVLSNQARPVGLRRSDEAHRMIAVQVVRTVHSQIVIVVRYVSGS